MGGGTRLSLQMINPRLDRGQCPLGAPPASEITPVDHPLQKMSGDGKPVSWLAQNLVLQVQRDGQTNLFGPWLPQDRTLQGSPQLREPPPVMPSEIAISLYVPSGTVGEHSFESRGELGRKTGESIEASDQRKCLEPSVAVNVFEFVDRPRRDEADQSRAIHGDDGQPRTPGRGAPVAHPQDELSTSVSAEVLDAVHPDVEPFLTPERDLALLTLLVDRHDHLRPWDPAVGSPQRRNAMSVDSIEARPDLVDPEISLLVQGNESLGGTGPIRTRPSVLSAWSGAAGSMDKCRDRENQSSESQDYRAGS